MQNRKQPRKLLIGVTGGIGSGKSLVCKYLSKCGSEIFYADKVARDLYGSNKKLKNELIKKFGNRILDDDNQVSFDKFRKVVFASSVNQKGVNKIVHPFVIDEILKRAKSVNSYLIFVEAALIFESGFDKYLDFTIEVYAPAGKRMIWVKKRRKLTYAQIRLIMKLQMSEREKLIKADFIIKNTSTKAALKKNTVFIHNLLKKISSSE